MQDSKPNSFQMDITIEDERWHQAFTQMQTDISAIVTAVIEKLEPSHAFLTIADRFTLDITLCDDKTIKALNNEWRGKNKATNVLSFPQIDDFVEECEIYPREVSIPIGDIIMAYETIERERVEQNKTIQAHSTHMLVHGFLHLLGFDHIDDGDAEIMEKLEIEILKGLNIASPYAMMAVD